MDRRERARFALAAGLGSASITRGGWHLILHLRVHRAGFGEFRQKHDLELYDLSEDPGCLENLAALQPDKAQELKARLVAWLQSAREFGWESSAEKTDSEVAELEALGYTDSGAETFELYTED